MQIDLANSLVKIILILLLRTGGYVKEWSISFRRGDEGLTTRKKLLATFLSFLNTRDERH